LLVILYAEYSAPADTRHYVVATLTLEAALIGAFVSLDLLVFWMFFVLELIPSYFLITRWGTGPHRNRAAGEYIVFMLIGSAAMLFGILVLAFNPRRETGAFSFDLLDLLATPVPAEFQSVIFFLLFVGFAVKTPVFPFHTWLPKVLEQGPVVGMSVFLVGIKLGTYGFLRFVIPLLPEAARQWAWVMLLLGAVGIVYGALIALIQTNLRRLLAFSSLSHMGAVLIALFSLNFSGFQGGLLQMVNLGIVGAGLFFVAGFLYSRVGAPDLSVMGDLVQRVPVLTATFLVIVLAGIGLPGTSGFNGEHLVMLGAFKVHWVMALATGLGTFLTAAYSLSFFQRGFMRRRAKEGAGSPVTPPMPDLRMRELIISVALGALVFWIGLDTGRFLRAMNGSLSALEVRVNQGSFGDGGHSSRKTDDG
ncbi:MAG: NADH-quinone oxidoreductase subunit M, partial [Actinobacteria bacterium]|nr:NADH-quinone oxidoreductase subunit M [Actinomycetota bacterium]